MTGHLMITDSVALAEFCDAIRDAPFICVDTEFMRESAYYPELCLVQVATPERAAAIDPLADGIDLTPLLDLMVADLRARGFERLFLGCSADPRVRSHGFYRHLGWRSTGTVDAAGDEVLELLCPKG